MKDIDINILLQKAEELKALFTLGQRVIPFLEEIFLFVKDIKPLLEEINVSIEDNLRKMPTASKQLSKVTEATELATTEIMDIVDGLFFKADIISSNLIKLTEIDQARSNSPLKILEIIQTALNHDADTKELLLQLTKAINQLRGKTSKEFDEITTHTNSILQSIREDSSSIMISLQVQDITSQQIAAVNHLLETIQHKLGEILTHFQASELTKLVEEQNKYVDRTDVSKLHRKVAFDPDAIDSIKNQETRQVEVDNLIEQHERGDLADMEDFVPEAEILNEISSTKDTDIIINNKIKDNTISKTKEKDEFEAFSQDDIDALFNGGN
jgi:chemotaxis regulatin CheY-phosphate phosphatase CheZ